MSEEDFLCSTFDSNACIPESSSWIQLLYWFPICCWAQKTQQDFQTCPHSFFYLRLLTLKLLQFAVEHLKNLPFLFCPVPVPCKRQQNRQSLYEDPKVILVKKKLKALYLFLVPTLILHMLLTSSTASSSATQPKEERQQPITEALNLDSNILPPELQLGQCLWCVSTAPLAGAGIILPHYHCITAQCHAIYAVKSRVSSALYVHLYYQSHHLLFLFPALLLTR